MSICLLDTSILCELLEIPGHCQRPEHRGRAWRALMAALGGIDPRR